MTHWTILVARIRRLQVAVLATKEKVCGQPLETTISVQTTWLELALSMALVTILMTSSMRVMTLEVDSNYPLVIKPQVISVQTTISSIVSVPYLAAVVKQIQQVAYKHLEAAFKSHRPQE